MTCLFICLKVGRSESSVRPSAASAAVVKKFVGTGSSFALTWLYRQNEIIEASSYVIIDIYFSVYMCY